MCLLLFAVLESFFLHPTVAVACVVVGYTFLRRRKKKSVY
jgi:hypothetical protein